MKTLKLLFVAIAAVCCSLVAEAAEPITYLDWDPVQKQMTNATATSYVVVTNGIEVFEAGTTYVVNDWVTAPFSVFVNGTESEPTILVLCDGGWLTVSRGVEVTDGHKLVICEQADGDEEATRQLTSTGCNDYAGIGGGWNGACGTIVINGGIVNATGGYQSAGIGGGFYGDNKDGGNVTINGGTVNARGHTNAAGIGGANGGAGGTVTINGGMVSGYGGASAAGIGGGYHGAGGTVAINGGMVTGEGGEESGAAGIGAGAYESPMDPGTVTFGPGMNYWILACTDWSDQVEVSTAEFIADHSAPSVFISSSPLPPGPTAKVVLENGGETLRFVYDNLDYGTRGTDWFSVAEAEAIDPYNEDVPWCDCGATVTKVVFDPSFAAYRPKQCGSWFYYFDVLAAVDGLKNLNTSVTTSMAYMFCGCWMLTTLDVSGFDTANVTDMYSMFWGCSLLTTLDVSGFDTANVTDMSIMFASCLSLETICASGRFVTDQVSDSSEMFHGCSKLVGGAGTAYVSTKTDKTYARIDGEGGQPGYFTRAPTAKAVVEDGGQTLRFVYDGKDYGTKGTNWFSVAEAEAIDPDSETVPWYGCREDVTKVVFDSSFAAYRPKQCCSWFIDFGVLAAVDGLKNLNTSVATNMAYMFCWCSSLTSLDVSSFDTSNVTYMNSMFYRCSSLTSLDVSSFDTSNATYMNSMFCYCSSLTSLDVTGFDTANVTDMDSMFGSCSSLTTLDVSGFDTANVTDMESMFGGCSSLTTLDVSGFDTANVTDMDSMFYGCSSLTTLDLASFDTSNVTDMAFMFYGCSSLEAICASDRFVTDQVSDSYSMFKDCSKLFGGAGTAYDSTKTDKTYAHIDGKDGQPGYFTEGHKEIKEIATGAYASLDLAKDLGIKIPDDVDYAKGDKVTVKVDGLAKGLKVVVTPVYEDPDARKKVVVDYVYTIEGVPTEAIDFEQQPMFARVTVTYKDKTKGDKGKVESLQPIVLSITTPEPSVLTAGVLNQVYGPVDIATLWPEVADAKTNPKEWSFKGWPAGLKYNATAKDASWSYKDGKATVKTNAEPWTVYGQPTKAGVFPITATWKHKLADNKTTVSETFSAVLTVWGDDGATDFRYEDQAYVATATKTLPGVTAASGLPTGLKFKAGQVTGTPTKAGVFAVTVKKTGNTKETFLWEVAPATAPTFALDTGTAPVEDLKAQIVQGANQAFAIATSDIAAKVTVTGLPTGLKLVATPVKVGTKTVGNTYSVEGIASKPGEYFVTFKTVLNGVTTVTTTAFTVKGNPFVATYRGYYYARPATNVAYRLAVAEVTVAAAGTLKLTYTEGKTKYTASVKSFDWNDATGKGTAEGLVLKVSSADKKLGYGDRKATVTLEDCGASLMARMVISDANGSSLVESDWGLHATVKTTEVPLPASQTFVFRTKDGADTNALATVSLAYDAKKATAAFSGKLYDGTAVKATVPVIRWSDGGTSDDYAFAPFLVIAKDGTVYCFDAFSSYEDGGYIYWVDEAGETIDWVRSPNADYSHADKRFAELVPAAGTFTFGWGSDAAPVGATEEKFAFVQTLDKSGKPAGVAISDADPQPGEKPLTTVTAKMGKVTGAISFTFTSKKGDKAKYAVELVWRGEELFAGHVTRTWKASEIVGGKSKQVSHTAYGTVDVK